MSGTLGPHRLLATALLTQSLYWPSLLTVGPTENICIGFHTHMAMWPLSGQWYLIRLDFWEG